MEVGNRVFFFEWILGHSHVLQGRNLGSLFSAGAVFAVFDGQAP